jgi:hypothetical protein
MVGSRNITVYSDLLQGKSVERWLRRLSDGTKYGYLDQMERFLEYAGPQEGFKDPDSLLSWAKQQDNLDVEDLIEKFADTHTKGTRNSGLAALRSFLRWNGYSLPKTGWAPNVTFLAGYTRPQILSLLSYLPKKHHKLAVFAQKDSGLRVNDLLYMKYEHIRADFEAGERMVHIRFEPERYQRRKSPGFTFLGPNTLNLLRPMIETGVIGSRSDQRILEISYSPLNGALRLAKEKANLDPKLQPTHGLRKFFENQLDKLGSEGKIDYHKKLQLEGHFQGVRKFYTARDVEELRELYSKLYPLLDLSEDAAAEIKTQTLEARLVEQRDDIRRMREELADNRERGRELETSLAFYKTRVQELQSLGSNISNRNP